MLIEKRGGSRGPKPKKHPWRGKGYNIFKQDHRDRTWIGYLSEKSKRAKVTKF